MPPGTAVEPALIGKQIASSITPVRDALHRLTGERLVEAPNHNAFRVPLPTETALRDIYNWNAQLLRLAARGIRPSPQCTEAPTIKPDGNLIASTADLFIYIARESGSAEHVRAIQQLNDRVAISRRRGTTVGCPCH